MQARVDGMNQTMVCLIAARPGQPGGKSQTEDTQEMTVVTQPALSDRTGSGESEGALDRPDDIHVYLPEIWAVHARHFPRKDAIVCGADRLSWRDFDQAMNRLANALHARGLGRGDKVAVLLGNEVMTIPVMFGVVKARACLVPLSAMLTPDQLAHLITDSGATTLIVAPGLIDRIAPVRERLDRVAPDRFVVLGPEQPGWTAYDAFLGEAPATQPPVRYALDDPFNIIYSSGTTGLPKGIVQTHRARQHWSFSNVIEMRFDQTSRALTTTALYSNGTWLMVLPVLFTGGTLHILPQFDPAAFLETVARERITHTFMVPTQYILTLACPALDRADLSSLKTMLSAGSPLRPDTKQAVLARMGPGLYELYGLTEGFATMLKPEFHATRLSSVGTPVLGFEVRIIDDEGRELPAGEAGEIAGYGAGMMAGYHGRPEATAAAIWRDERGRSFIRTGDIGRLDEAGFLYILDRKKDMIVSGGFNVFPTDVETVLGGHPDVLDVTVIGVPHEKWGEAALALVIPRDDTRVTEADLKAWANDRLAKTQRLVGVEFRTEFPRNALGKVLKRELRAPYWAAEGRVI